MKRTVFWKRMTALALAAILLSATLSWSFWQGAGMVCLGSLLCWYATRR